MYYSLYLISYILSLSLSPCPLFYFSLYFIANLPHLFHFFFFCPGKFRRVGKTPLHPLCHSRKKRAFLSRIPFTHGYDIAVQPALLIILKHVIYCIFRNIHPVFFHCFNHKWVQLTRFYARAFSLEPVSKQ